VNGGRQPIAAVSAMPSLSRRDLAHANILQESALRGTIDAPATGGQLVPLEDLEPPARP
jgi:hypothetical protein